MLQAKPPLSFIPSLIFSSRWLQLPLYIGLIVAQGVYVILFVKELLHLIMHATSFGEQQIMLIVLGLIDVVMISNLLLSHVNASVLKVKLAMAIIGISSIHLLKTFIAAGTLEGLPFCAGDALVSAAQAAINGTVQTCSTLTPQGVMWQTIIHCVFILSAIGIAYTDHLMHSIPRSKPAAAH